MAEKIIAFLKNYETKIVVLIGFFLIAGVSFSFGLIQGKKVQDRPLIIETPAPSQNVKANEVSATASQAKNLAQETKNDIASTKIPSQDLLVGKQDCAFVGSKNSEKYHLPTCQWAKRILPKNLVCYKSEQEAIAKNKTGDKNCIK